MSNIGDCMEGKQVRLDVTSLMIFTNLLETINRKVAVSIDGVWFNILVKEDVTVNVGDKEESWAGSEFSSEEVGDDESTAEREKEGEGGEVVASAVYARLGEDDGGFMRCVRKAEDIAVD